MPQPTRDSSAGRAYNDLRNLARRTGRRSDELMLDYVLERFLYRMSISTFGGRSFVLKGGLLLARFGARRATRDIDILGRGFDGADESEVIRRITAIAATEVDDGVVFDTDSLRAVPIREDGEYHGTRLSMAACLSRARLKLQLDISFGDPVTPAPETVAYPQQLSQETFQLLGYPLATVIAEKLSTAIELGSLNTRERDYGDIYRLASLHPFAGGELAAALSATATHRRTELRPLSISLEHPPEFADLRQSSYAAWRRRQGMAAAHYPEAFADVVAHVIAFSDPLLSENANMLAGIPSAAPGREMPSPVQPVASRSRCWASRCAPMRSRAVTASGILTRS